MTEPIRYVEVRMMLPIDVYMAVERKATPAKITAGIFLAHFITASVRARPGHPKFVLETAPEVTTSPSNLAQQPRKKRKPPVRILDSDMPRMRELVSRDASLEEIASAFGISVPSAYVWRRTIRQQLADAA